MGGIGVTAPASPPTPGTLTTPLEAEPMLGGLYHTYRRAA
jgi:hypothetical protein